MTRVAAVVLVAALAVLAVAGVSSAQPHARSQLTIIGDSVAAALQYPRASSYLRRHFRVQLDLKVCRRLVAASCVYNGVRATTALQAIWTTRASLGRTVVIDVGYNDSATTYARDLDRVMRLLVAIGVPTVVWTTLRRYGSVRRRQINRVIRAARERWPDLRVADWEAWSRGHRTWFAEDGLHLNSTGALSLARLIRRTVRNAARSAPGGSAARAQPAAAASAARSE